MATEITETGSGATDHPDAEKSKRELLYAFIVVFFGLPRSLSVSKTPSALIPLKNLLKNELNENPLCNSGLFSSGSAWHGTSNHFLESSPTPFPFSRHSPQETISSPGAFDSLSPVSSGSSTLRTDTSALLAMCIAINVFMVITSTAVGGFMTEKAQLLKASGRFASVFQVAYQTPSVVGGTLRRNFGRRGVRMDGPGERGNHAPAHTPPPSSSSRKNE